MARNIKILLMVVTIVFFILGFLSVIPIGVAYFFGYGTLGTTLIISNWKYKKLKDKSLFRGNLILAIVNYCAGIVFLLFR